MSDRRQPRLAFLHYTCPPVVGGVERVLAAQARLLRARGYPVTVVAGRGRRFAPDVPVVLVPLLSATHPRIRAAHAALERGDRAPLARASDEIGRALRRRLAGVDLCIVHNVFTLAKNLALTTALRDLAASLRRPRFVAWTHDVWDGGQGLVRQHPWHHLKMALTRVAYVAVSEAAKAALVHATGADAAAVTVIPNGIDEERLMAAAPATRALVDRLRLDPHDLVLLMPVRVTRRKNLELAVDITAQLFRMGRRPRLLVTGPPGPHTPANRQYLDDLIRRAAAQGVAGAVTFLAARGDRRHPRITSRVIGDFYRLCDGVLLTSTQEGFGLPPLEAGLFRAPVFCTDIPAFREVAGEYAVYFSPHDSPQQIAHRVVAFFDGDRASQLRRHARTGFGWDAVIGEGVEPLVRRLVGRTRA